MNLKARIEFYKQQLQKVTDADSVSNAAAGVAGDGAASLSTDSTSE